jgi:HAE1 family hydrophobic/amphiphilic exporter-1
VQDLVMALGRQNIEIPAGNFGSGRQNMVLRTDARFASVEELGRTTIATVQGIPVSLAEVATIEDSFEERASITRLDGRPAVAVQLIKQSDANTVAVAREVHERMAALKATAPAGITIQMVQDNSTTIVASIETVQLDLVLGAFLAIVIIFIFLRDWRATLISALALPTSVIGTFAFVKVMGFTLNMMTTLALSLSIGILIDDAIVVIENIVRRRTVLQGDRHGGGPARHRRDRPGRVRHHHVHRGGVRAGGLHGGHDRAVLLRVRPHRGRGRAAVAVRVLHAHAHALGALPGRPPRGEHRASRPRSRPCSTGSTRATAGSSASRCATAPSPSARPARCWWPASAWPACWASSSSPWRTRRSSSCAWSCPRAPASRPRTRPRLAGGQRPARDPRRVKSTFATVGGGAQEQRNLATVLVLLEPRAARAYHQTEIMAFARERLAGSTEFTSSVEAADDNGSGGQRNAEVQLDLRGSDLEELQASAQRIVDGSARTRGGYVDVDTSFRTGKPEMRVEVRRAVIDDLGISADTVASTARTLFAGTVATSIEDEANQIDVRVRLPEEARNIYTASHANVISAQGRPVPLGILADVSLVSGPSRVDRQSRQRQVTVYANLSGKPLGDAMAEVQAISDDVVGDGVTAAFGGTAQMMEESMASMLLSIFLAVICVYMILAAQFESFLHPLTIMSSLPFSLIGAFGALLLTGNTMTIFAMIGLIMLFGLVTKNAISAHRLRHPAAR